MLILKNIELFSLSDTLNKDNQFDLLLWTNCFALFLIAYSREKNEDERIQLIRDWTYRVSSVFMIALFMSLSFNAIIFKLDPSFFNIGHIAPIIIILALCFHLILFYSRIFGNADTTGPELTLKQNIARNKTLFLIYLTINIIIILLLLFL